MSHFPFASGAYGRASERFERTVGMIAGCASLMRGLGVWCLDILFVLTHTGSTDPATRAAGSQTADVSETQTSVPDAVEILYFDRKIGRMVKVLRVELVAPERAIVRDGTARDTRQLLEEIRAAHGIGPEAGDQFLGAILEHFHHQDTAVAFGGWYARPTWTYN